MHDLIKEDYTGSGDFTFSPDPSIGTALSIHFDFVLLMPVTPKECKIVIKDQPITLDSSELANLEMRSWMKREPLKCSLKGMTNGGGRITCEKLLVRNFNHLDSLSFELYPNEELTIYYPINAATSDAQNVYLLTNLLLWGDEIIQRGQLREGVKSVIELNGEKLQFVRLLSYDETKRSLANSPLAFITTEVTTTANTNIDTEYNEVIWPLCWLCTLAEHCFVTPVYCGVKVGDSWNKISYKTGLTYPCNRIDASVDFSHVGNNLATYLEMCYKEYKRWADALRLNIIIEYAVDASVARDLDTACLFLSVGLECLATNGAKYLKGKGVKLSPSYQDLDRTHNKLRKFMKRHERNFIRRHKSSTKRHKLRVTESELQRLAEDISKRNPSFDEKLSKILERFQIKVTDDDLEALRKIRNSLMHGGLLPEDQLFPYASIKESEESLSESLDADEDKLTLTIESTQKLRDFYDDIVLTILGYRDRDCILRSDGYEPKRLE